VRRFLLVVPVVGEEAIVLRLLRLHLGEERVALRAPLRVH